MIGGFYSRYRWKQFRERFTSLGFAPLLDYRQYRQLEISGDSLQKNEDRIFRFTGGIESITDDHTLWVRGQDLTISVSLEKTKCYLLPKREGEGTPDSPEQIRWNRVSTLTEGIKVFIGGKINMQNNRLSFDTTKENPLIVIFYSCPEDELTSEIIRTARTHNEYWNSFTPVTLVIGALSLIYIAASFLNRPAFQLTVLTALVAIFVPIFPIIPPGLLFTVLYRRMTWHARVLKTNRDLLKLPIHNDGKLPEAPAVPDTRYALKAYFMEAVSWIVLLAGICLNIAFIYLIIFLLVGG